MKREVADRGAGLRKVPPLFDLASADPRNLAVVELDHRGVVISLSPVAEELFGYTAEAIIGRPFTDLFRSDGSDALERSIDDFGNAADSPVRKQSLRAVGCRQDGAEFEAMLTLAKRSRDGDQSAMTATVEARLSGARPEEPQTETSVETRRAQLAFEGAPVGMALVSLESDRAGVITDVNFAMSIITGRAASELVGLSIADITEPVDVDVDADLLRDLLAGEIPSYEVSKRFRRSDGTPFWGELSVSLIRDEHSHRPVYLVAQLADITERRRMEDALHVSHDRLASLFDEAPIGMGLATLDNRWIQVNQALCQTLGYSEAELLNERLEDMIAGDEVETVARYLHQLLAGDLAGFHVETRAARADGELVCVQLSVSLVHDYDGASAYVLVAVQDMSERKRLEEELEQGALLDAVTGLPSRALLLDRLEQARARLERTGSPFVVMFVQADRLDAVGARFGPERADAALRAMGARLLAAVRSGDTVARYSGDEFVIVCEDLENQDEARAIAQRALDLGRCTVGDGEAAVDIGLTVGLTVAADPDDSPAGLVERADAAMQIAQGRRVDVQEYRDPV